MVNKIKEIANELKKYNNFQECIIENIIFSDYGTSITVFFNNIWENNIETRKNLNEKHIVIIKFSLVNKFLIENDLSQALIDEPYMLNWGFNEISTINLLGTVNNQFIRAEICWETKRKIIIEFMNMNLESLIGP